MALPQGTVTFLFTDIEGSTALLREHGEGYAEILSEHRGLLRSAFAEHGGTEVDTQGDAFFVAFPRASSALAAARRAQEALTAGPVRVRMGIHTGEPLVGEEGYVGMSVHRAARIAGAAHGGQVLVSQAARELVDVELRDLGEHRLKDLGAPQRLYQLGDEEFPPLRSLDVARTNLPIQPTRFIGRGRELAETLALLREDDVRLLTLLGPGGIGKTRLALQVAAESVADFSAGAWFVPLAEVTQASQLRERVAAALSLQSDAELEHFLRDRQVLLVLDNLEQVTGAGKEIAALLAGAPELRVVVASRAPLRVTGEQQYPVPPLDVEEARALFARRARSVVPEFALGAATHDVDAICERLDRLPLAIELAAARSKLLRPDELLARLEKRLPLLAARAVDVPERQRTLRATIDWSYELLDPDEQALFRRLGVFAGGFTDAACAAVADIPEPFELLESLVDKSLVYHRRGRFGLLETIREFALERLLEGDDESAVRARHAEYFTAAGDRFAAERRFGGADLPPAFEELDNLREAVRWARAERRGPVAAELIAANFAIISALPLGESDQLVAYSLEQSGLSAGRRLSLLGLKARGFVQRGDHQAALAIAGERVALATEANDSFELGWALNDRGLVLIRLGKAEQASEDIRRACELFESAGFVSATLSVKVNLAFLSVTAGDLEGGEAELEALLQQPGLQKIPRAWCAGNLACLKILSGEWEDARALLGAALPVVWEARDELFEFCLELLAAISVEDGDPRRSARLLGLARASLDERGVRVLDREAREVDLFERTYDRSRRLLGDEQFVAEQRKGRALLLNFRPDQVL